MKKIKNSLPAWLLCMVMAFLVMSLAEPNPVCAASAPKLKKTSMTIVSGQKSSICLKNDDLSWLITKASCSNTKVLGIQVSKYSGHKESGQSVDITARKAGSATVRVTVKKGSQTKTLKCKIKVKNEKYAIRSWTAGSVTYTSANEWDEGTFTISNIKAKAKNGKTYDITDSIDPDFISIRTKSSYINGKKSKKGSFVFEGIDFLKLNTDNQGKYWVTLYGGTCTYGNCSYAMNSITIEFNLDGTILNVTTGKLERNEYA